MIKESWYASKLSDMNIVRIHESDDFVVDYDKNRSMYRVSYFEDGHFVDECWFDAYKQEYQLTFNEEEISEYILKTLNPSKTPYHKECREKAERRLEKYLSEHR